MILWVYIVLSFTFSFTSLAVSLHFLEEHQAEDLPLLWASIGAPWALKPFLGAIVDSFWGRPKWICLGFSWGNLLLPCPPLRNMDHRRFRVGLSGRLRRRRAHGRNVQRRGESPTQKYWGARPRDSSRDYPGGVVYTWGYSLVMRGVAIPLLTMGVASLDLPNVGRRCTLPKWSWKLCLLQIICFLLPLPPPRIPISS